MRNQASIFEAFLDGRGLKFTRARQLILETVFSLHEHFDAEQLYDIIHKVSRDVSRATVYRTLPLLVEAGLIQKSVRSEARDTFEHIYGHPRHAHWVCKVCGAVGETEIQDVLKLLQAKARAQNFALEEVSLAVSGVCWKCRNANESQ